MRNYCKLPVNCLTGAQAGNRNEVISADINVVEIYYLMHFEELNCLFLKIKCNLQTCIACQVAGFFFFFQKSVKVPIFSILCPSLAKWQTTYEVICGQSLLSMNPKNERTILHREW